MAVFVSKPGNVTAGKLVLLFEEYGMMPRCSMCRKYLKPGDQLDHHWPYYDDYNLCQKCKIKKIKEDIKCQKSKTN